MIPDVTIPVERFHRVLVDEIQKQRPTYLDHSFTVAEIYQILVPYRSHRDALGVEMNGDYEDALLRLLAGAGDLVVLESDDARTRILKELQSKNPNTGLFREFAGAGVHLNPEGLPNSMRAETTGQDDVSAAGLQEPHAVSVPAEGFVAGEISPASEAHGASPAEPAGMEATYFDFETSSLEALETEPETPTAVESKVAESRPVAEAQPTASQPVAEVRGVINGAAAAEAKAKPSHTISLVSATEKPSAEPGAGFWKPGEHPVSTTTMTESSSSAASPIRASVSDCLWCNEQLPDRADVNFCPQCGVNTSVKPCGGCRAEMEASWKFCISCGSKAQAS